MVQIVDVSAVIVEVKTVETVWAKLRKACGSMLRQGSVSIFTIWEAKSTISMWEELSFLMRLG
ncbi:hypothetical protein PN499_23125 [Kamptonema animale CS-326]|jgi:Na+-translocating ferredoxin:NAD+ oxidoreductase RNF subunit RnfB|uniref:hypothetical protein n=1 Tax=Kamptonema animale TaxID=92934 RepID=UPI00232FB5A6|nr:hypothetical protein [Kamptonema animale]MDB9514097.1 hypothetical protein [Kamptonema animale CS-326]